MSHCRSGAGAHCHPRNAAVFTAAAAARHHQQQISQQRAQTQQSQHHSHHHSTPQHSSSNYSPTMFTRGAAPSAQTLPQQAVDKSQQELENEWTRQSVTL